MKKHWYDYLWVVSLTYLVLGFFNILFAWLGLLCFFIPLIISIVSGTKGYCNRYCGRGQLFGLLGGRFGLSRKKDIPNWMKSKVFRCGFLIFFFIMFFQMLWVLPLGYISGLCRNSGAETGRDSALDLQAALELGLSRDAVPSGRGSVRLWLLQRNAHLHRPGPHYDGAVQAPQLVRLLPHGDHDPVDLPGQKPGRVNSIPAASLCA